MRVTRTRGAQEARDEYQNNTALLALTLPELDAAAVLLGVPFFLLYDYVEEERQKRLDTAAATMFLP